VGVAAKEGGVPEAVGFAAGGTDVLLCLHDHIIIILLNISVSTQNGMNYLPSLQPSPATKAQRDPLDAPDANALFQSSIVRGNGLSIGDTIDQLDDIVTDVYGLHELALPSYSDQVLPFDITLAAANEYGAMCAGKILGVEILNEGSGISVDDAVSEASATIVARAIEPMQAVPSKFSGTVGGELLRA